MRVTVGVRVGAGVWVGNGGDAEDSNGMFLLGADAIDAADDETDDHDRSTQEGHQTQDRIFPDTPEQVLRWLEILFQLFFPTTADGWNGCDVVTGFTGTEDDQATLGSFIVRVGAKGGFQAVDTLGVGLDEGAHPEPVIGFGGIWSAEGG